MNPRPFDPELVIPVAGTIVGFDGQRFGPAGGHRDRGRARRQVRELEIKRRPLGADALLRRNLLVWGLGGVIIPFIGIKLIDMVMVALHLVA